MKLGRKALGTALLGALAEGALAQGPILVERIGKLEHSGRAWECELYPTHPELKGKERYLQGLAVAAQAKPFDKADHRARRVPSVEIVAYAPAVSKKGKASRRAVALLKDYVYHEERQGPEAKELIALTDRLCQERIQP